MSKSTNLQNSYNREGESSSEAITQDKNRRKMGRFTKAAIISGVLAFIFCLFGLLLVGLSRSLHHSIHGLFVIGTILFRLAPALGIVGLVLGIIALVKISFHNKKLSRLVSASIVFLLLGLIFLILSILSAGQSLSFLSSMRNFLTDFSILFLFIVAPVLCIISLANILFRIKELSARFLAVAAIVCLSIPVAISIPMVLASNLPFIYTPPALTPDNLKVYNECIKFVGNHNEHKNLAFTRRKWLLVSFGDRFYSLRHLRVKEVFPEHEITGLKTLADQLKSIKCHKFQRDNDVLLFYKMAHYALPFPDLIEYYSSFLPVGPGVLYSLNAENPNEIDSEVLKAAKPFVKSAGHWYISRKLVLRGPRSDIPTSIPKSLIDHSLRTKGLNIGDDTDKKSE